MTLARGLDAVLCVGINPDWSCGQPQWSTMALDLRTKKQSMLSTVATRSNEPQREDIHFMRKPMRHSWIVVTVLAAGVGQLGCIAWQGGMARKIDPFPTAAMQKGPPSSIAIDVKFSVVGPFSPGPDRLAKATATLLGKAMSVAVRSRRFVPSTMPQTADYHLTLQIRDDGSPNVGLAILSGFTFLVFPAWASDDYDIVATLQARTGQVVGTYHLQQSQTMFMELLMIFGMPFASPVSVSERLWNQVFEDVFTFCDEQVRLRGAAPPPGPPTAEEWAPRGRT